MTGVQTCTLPICMRIVVELKKDANEQIVLNKLFSYTQLQDTVSVNMLALVNGEPKTLTLKQVLQEYLQFQVDVITNRSKFDLEKAKKRAHILQGFLLAIDYIDEVIAILRDSKTVPEGKARLMERFIFLPSMMSSWFSKQTSFKNLPRRPLAIF